MILYQLAQTMKERKMLETLIAEKPEDAGELMQQKEQIDEEIISQACRSMEGGLPEWIRDTDFEADFESEREYELV